MSAILELPFDQYQRYRTVAELVASLRAGDEPLRILDVGGRTGLLREFLPDDRIALVDLEPSAVQGLVLGDGAALPFADGSLDAVCAFDTLEHVPPTAREAFVHEAARVARRWVVLAGPYAAPAVDEAEELLLRFLREKLEVDHRYLAEHRHNGLPAREAVEGWLKEAGAEVASFGHGNVERWLGQMCLSLYMDHEADLRGLAKAFHRFYNERLFPLDRTEPVYRHVVVAALAGAPLPKPLPAPKPASRASDDGRLFRLAFDLTGFDRARGRWSEERAALGETIETVRADLAGHKATLDEERAESARLRSVRDALAAELDCTQKDLLRHVEETREIECAAAERAAEQMKHALALERELGAHRTEITHVRAELERAESEREGARAELEELRGRLAERERDARERATIAEALRADLEGHRATLAAVRAAEEALRAEAKSLIEKLDAAQRALAEREERIARQRAALRSRADSLKRAFGPKRDL